VEDHPEIVHLVTVSNWYVHAGLDDETCLEIEIDTLVIPAVYIQAQHLHGWQDIFE
jgi:hypothetical protein